MHRVGDELVSVNGQSLENLSTEEARKIFDGLPDGPMQLHLRRHPQGIDHSIASQVSSFADTNDDFVVQCRCGPEADLFLSNFDCFSFIDNST